MSALQRCLHYSATLLNTDTKGTETSVCITEMSALQFNRLNMDTKGTEPSVGIKKVSVLQSDRLNMGTEGTEPSVCITEVYYHQTSLIRTQKDRIKCSHHRDVEEGIV